jgi:hypothetical protein
LGYVASKKEKNAYFKDAPVEEERLIGLGSDGLTILRRILD